MSSPFPGMDPYLENPQDWVEVHHRLITSSGDQLIRRLAPKYFAQIERRTYVADPNDSALGVIVPDVHFVRNPAQTSMPEQTQATAVEEPVEAITVRPAEIEVHEPFLKIVDGAGRQVVAIVEFLSPANKTPSSAGFESYAQKRTQIMESATHLVEIDLLREGRSPITSGLVWRNKGQYLAHVSKTTRRPKGWLWSIYLERGLPTIRIPLMEPDPDAELDLQAVFTDVYDRAGYASRSDYTRPPTPALPAPLDAWADRLLKEKGLR